jgi:hypothetical protein
MLDEQKNDSISFAVQERLDDLFEENDTSASVKESADNLTRILHRSRELTQLESFSLNHDKKFS